MFTVYQNFLPIDNFKGLHRRLSLEPGWKFALTSYPTDTYDTGHSDSSTTFWMKELNDDKFFTNTMFNLICETTKLDLVIDRVYANGQTHGLSGDLHIDDSRLDYYTFLYYTNPVWLAEWGGCTIFSELPNPIENKLTQPQLKNNSEKINTQIFLPRPNTGLLYKSNVTHIGLEPTRRCKELRITISYKMKLRRMRD